MSNQQDVRRGPRATSFAADIEDTLRSFGYDIEPPRPGNPPEGNVVARRDLGDRVILFTVDGGGRFRAEITWLVGEWPSRQAIAGVPVRVVDSVTRAVSIAGQAAEPGDLAGVVRGLGDIVPWAVATDDEPASPPESSTPS
jgi:hypothetical protein